MCRHKILPRGCFLASNMTIYLTENKKFRVRSRSEVPRHACQHRMAFWEKCQDPSQIHAKSMQNQCKSAEPMDFNGFSQLECLAMLTAMPWHLISTSDPDFFVLSQVNDHIRSQEASLCRNFYSGRRPGAVGAWRA